MMFFSCNLTKNLKDNEKLLVKNKIVIVDDDNNDIKDPGFEEFDIKQVIKPKLNTKFIILPVNLWVYYLYDPKKIEKKEKKKNNRCNSKNKRKISRVSKKIRAVEKNINNSEINSSEYNKFNKRLLRFQNKKEKKEEKDCNKLHWSQKVGEPPVLYKTNDEYRNKRKIRVLLKNKGYYDPIIKVGTKPRKNNKKKIIVNYKIKPGRPYIINKINYNIEDPNIKKIILADTANTLIKKGSRTDTKLIEKERKRISDKLRNTAYYKFSKDFIYFSVDTIGKNHLSEIIVNIKNPVNENNETTFHKRYKINNIYIYPNYNPKKALINKEEYFSTNDTIIFYSKDGLKYNIIYTDIPRINPKSFVKGLYIAPGEYYNTKDIKASYKYLASLQIIQTANINFNDVQIFPEENDSIKYIDCVIRLTQDDLQSIAVAAEFTNSSGNLGIAFSNNYEHQNIFRNTEVLNLKLNFALQRLPKSSEDTDTLGFFNSKEAGGNLSLKFPRLLAPLSWKKFIKRSNPYTIIQVDYNFLERPDYTRSIAGTSFGYNWNSTKMISHSFIPITGDLVKLKNPTEEFQEYIKKWNLEEIYDDRLVFGSSYRFTFNNQLVSQKRNFIFFSVYTKPAGNSLSLIMKMSDQDKEDGSYKIDDNVFAQFIKTDFDFRYYRKLTREKDMIVFRLFAGIAFPYGNNNVIPFSERYSSGGANGIRAWPVRTLGPGSYKNKDEDDFYPNQTSDIKLETNLEYRMKLFWMLEGALFIDAGNIWAINEYDIRAGAQFDFNDFYKEIAVGSGFGLRLDIEFVVIRLDLGRKLFDPSKPIDQRFVSAASGWNEIKKIWTLNFAIGFPF